MSDGNGFEVTVSAGSLRPSNGVVMAHRWTPEGVVVETEFTGAHRYHLVSGGDSLPACIAWPHSRWDDSTTRAHS